MNRLPFGYKIKFFPVRKLCKDLVGYRPILYRKGEIIKINDPILAYDFDFLLLEISITYFLKSRIDKKLIFPLGQNRIDENFFNDLKRIKSVYTDFDFTKLVLEYNKTTLEYIDNFIINQLKKDKIVTNLLLNDLLIWNNINPALWDCFVLDFNFFNGFLSKEIQTDIISNFTETCKSVNRKLMIVNVDNEDIYNICKQAKVSYFSGKHLNNVSVYSYIELSNRELDVANLIKVGKTNQEIADTLFLSVHTVKNHVRKILTKNGLSNRSQIASLV